MEGPEFSGAVFEQLSRLAAAFGSSARIAIIHLLAQGERNVEGIARETSLGFANASRHLQVLKGAGLLSSRKEGLQVFYRLAGPEVLEGYQALQRLARSRMAELGRIAREYFAEADGLSPVDGKELMERVRRGEAIVIDVRPEEEYGEGHIPGAVSVPLSLLEKRIPKIPKGVEVVAYCRGPYCYLAAEAVRLLRKKGRRALRLEEGFPEWKAAGHPVERADRQ